MLGLLYLRMENFHRAFELLGQAMTFDPENYKVVFCDIMVTEIFRIRNYPISLSVVCDKLVWIII